MKRMEARVEVAKGLKICRFCGALNRDINHVCFNCSWGGVFDYDSDHITALVSDYGHKMGQSLAPAPVEETDWRDAMLSRLQAFARLFQWRLLH